MGATIVARKVINIPCVTFPLTTCAKIEVGLIDTDSGKYRVNFEAGFSKKPAVVVTGVGVYEIKIPIIGKSIRLPVPIIVTGVEKDHFDYWLPAGHAYFSYIAAESD